MRELLELRWHGRGGQGVKTAALLLADVAFHTGKYIQGFPEYGPERMGAPVTAYNRISGEKIRIHSNIYEPDYVGVVDETLLNSVAVSAGLRPEGGILLNTARSPGEVRALLGGYDGRVCTIDARRVSEDVLGAYFPNMPMLAAMVKLSGVMDEETFLRHMRDSLRHKFAGKPQAAEGNYRVLEISFGEVCEA